MNLNRRRLFQLFGAAVVGAPAAAAAPAVSRSALALIKDFFWNGQKRVVSPPPLASCPIMDEMCAMVTRDINRVTGIRIEAFQSSGPIFFDRKFLSEADLEKFNFQPGPLQLMPEPGPENEIEYIGPPCPFIQARLAPGSKVVKPGEPASWLNSPGGAKGDGD